MISEQMNKPNTDRQKNIVIIVLAAVAVLAVAFAVRTMLSKDSDGGSDDGAVYRQVTADDDEDGGTSETVKVLTDTIELPQFSWINLKAGTKEQELTFKNPPQNFARIRVSLLLSDRTVLWTSDIILPGKTSEKVVLSRALPAGEYKDSIIKYECFEGDGSQTPLNGAENTLILKVQ